MSQTARTTTRKTNGNGAAAAATAAVNEEAKARMNDGVERMTEGMTRMGTYGQENMEALMAMASTFTKGMERIVHANTDFAKSQIEASQARLQKMAKIRTPQEYFETTSEAVRETMEAGLSQANKVTDMMVETTREGVQPISKRYTAMVETMQAR
jgi:phasin family protein